MEEKTPLLYNTETQDLDSAPPNLSLCFSFLSEENIDRELFCTICKKIFTNPVRSVNCGHTFCQDCYERLGSGSVCPLDQLQFKQMQFDRLVFNLIENLQTDCQICHWTGIKSNLRLHLKEVHSIELPNIPHGNFEYQAVTAPTVPPPISPQIPNNNPINFNNNAYMMPNQQPYLIPNSMPRSPMIYQQSTCVSSWSTSGS